MPLVSLGRSTFLPLPGADLRMHPPWSSPTCWTTFPAQFAHFRASERACTYVGNNSQFIGNLALYSSCSSGGNSNILKAQELRLAKALLGGQCGGPISKINLTIIIRNFRHKGDTFSFKEPEFTICEAICSRAWTEEDMDSDEVVFRRSLDRASGLSLRRPCGAWRTEESTNVLWVLIINLLPLILLICLFSLSKTILWS